MHHQTFFLSLSLFRSSPESTADQGAYHISSGNVIISLQSQSQEEEEEEGEQSQN